MKRNAKVVAFDGDERITVLIRINTNKYRLSKGEVGRIAVATANNVADGLRSLPYTKFGPHNTKVEV